MSHYHTVKISVRSDTSYYHFDLIKTDGQTDRHPDIPNLIALTWTVLTLTLTLTELGFNNRWKF